MIQPLDRDTFMTQMDRAENAGDISLGAVKRFWDWMYSDSNGAVQVCAFPVPTEDKSPDEMGSGHWIHAKTYDEFKDFCQTYSGMWRYHVYAGVNTLNDVPENGRGSTEHIHTVNHVSFDIETERESYGGADKEEVWWCYKYALAQAKFIHEEYTSTGGKFQFWPMIVMSENGIHMHYKADFHAKEELIKGKSHIHTKYITHQAMDCKYAKRIEEKAPDYIEFGQDDVSDIPRVMKVPGTRGIKSENGRLCGIIHLPPKDEVDWFFDEDVDVPQDFIEETEEETTDDEEKVESVEVTPEDASTDVLTRVKSLCKKEPLFRRLFEGDISDYDSRSEAEFAFVMKMLNHSFESEEINQIMWASGMSKWNEESDHYRERTIQKALERFDGNTVKDSTNGSFSFSRHG